MPRRLPDCCPSLGFETGLEAETFTKTRCWLLPKKRGTKWKTGKDVFNKAGKVYLAAHEAAAAAMDRGFLSRVTVCHKGCPTKKVPQRLRSKQMRYCLFVRRKPIREDIGLQREAAARRLKFKW